jgi:hypothetical protein
MASLDCGPAVHTNFSTMRCRCSLWLIASGLLLACEQADAPEPSATGEHIAMGAAAPAIESSGASGIGGDDATGGASGNRSSSGARGTSRAGGAGGESDTGNETVSGATGDSSAPQLDAGPAIDASAELYDEEAVPRFDIVLPQASLAMLTADGDTYVRGELHYGAETVSNIGVRIKGSSSRRTLEEKPAFKLKFDEFVPQQSFRGLRRMTLNNMVEDPSFIAERLAYALFRAAKLAAPRCNSALVYVNDQPYGVYANVETEDKTFLRRWFTDDDGNLYEVNKNDFAEGAEQLFELETNESENDRSDLRHFIDVFAASSASSFLGDMDPVLDLQHFLRFTAAEAAVNQWDMYGYTVFYPNNFRLYEDPSSQKVVFLPWGMDMSMKPFPGTDRPHIPIYELARANDDPAAPVTAGLLFQRCLESTACRAQYTAAVRDIIAVYESLDLESIAERYHAQIESQVLADPRTPYDADQFESAHQKVLSIIKARPSTIRTELDP